MRGENMTKGSIEEILGRMTPRQYALTVGTKSEDPLTRAFGQKRVVHPGARGAPVAPEKRPAAWRDLLRTPGITQKKRVAYIHIPFCSHICLYCGFFQNYTQEERETEYVSRLIREMEMFHQQADFAGEPLQAVFIGGGTPSALSAKNAGRMLDAIRRYLTLANDCELTLEARVHDLTDDKMEAWFAGGVNRVSVGVQSFNTEIRRRVGRIDARETVLERLHKLASYGQATVIIDLIYGLPGQREADLLADLAEVDALPIDGMDLYQLNVFESSLLKKAIDAGTVPPAAATAEQAAYFRAAETWLGDRAYTRVSNCHWAKTNRERSLYNILAKCGAEVIPFGAGAGGSIGRMSLFLQRDYQAYLDMIDRDEKPLMFMAEQSPLKSLHDDMLAQLERGYFDLRALTARYGEAVGELDYLLKIWEEHGLLIRGPVLSRLTVAGKFWHMNIAQSLIECAEALLEGRHRVEVEPIAAQG